MGSRLQHALHPNCLTIGGAGTESAVDDTRPEPQPCRPRSLSTGAMQEIYCRMGGAAELNLAIAPAPLLEIVKANARVGKLERDIR